MDTHELRELIALAASHGQSQATQTAQQAEINALRGKLREDGEQSEEVRKLGEQVASLTSDLEKALRERQEALDRLEES